MVNRCRKLYWKIAELGSYLVTYRLNEIKKYMLHLFRAKCSLDKYYLSSEWVLRVITQVRYISYYILQIHTNCVEMNKSVVIIWEFII